MFDAGPACAGSEPGLWFPADDEPYARFVARSGPALAICAGCSARSACLERELARPMTQQDGIYGGLLPHERVELIQARRRAAESRRRAQGRAAA